MNTKKTINHYLEYNSSYRDHYGKYLQAYRPEKEKDLEKYLLNLIRPKENESILDCGCGFGSVSELLSTKCKSITGLNICENQLPIKASKVLYKKGDFDNVSDLFSDTSFDKIIFLETMGYSKDLGKLIAQCKKILNKKGKLIIKEFFLKKISNKKLLKLQTEQFNFVQDFYNYKIINQDRILNELESQSMKVSKNRLPDFDCAWDCAFSFEQNSLPVNFPKIMHKHTPKDNLFTCLEIIAENT